MNDSSSNAGGRGAWVTTLATAVAVPLLVLLTLAWRSSDGPATHPVSAWSTQDARLEPTPSGVRLTVGATAARLRHDLEPGHPAFARFSCRLTVIRASSRRSTLQVGLEYRSGDAADAPWRGVDLTDQVGRGDGVELVASADDAPGLAAADQIALVITSPGQVQLAIDDARLETVSLGGRLGEMLGRLTTPQPLSHAHNNFIESPRVAGHEWTYVHWWSLGILVALLCVRRWVLRRRIAVGMHAAASAVVLVGFMDLRNSVDYWSQAREAVARRTESDDLYEYLDNAREFAWFGAVLRYLHEELPEGAPYCLSIEGERLGSVDVRRMAYLAFPAQWVKTPDEARVAIVVGRPAVGLVPESEWREVAQPRPRVKVYERR